mgnify:CR=1 FL=1
MLAGAGLLKGAIGVFGLLGVLALCAYPFLQLGIQYLLYKLTAFLASVIGDTDLCGLIGGLGGAFGPGHGGKLRAGAAGVHSGLRGRGDIMMAAARAWLTAVVSVTLLLSVVQTLMPKGSLREITSFVGGLLLLAVLLRPLGSVDLSAVSLNLDAYRQTVEQRQAELEQEGQKELVGLIEAELESYISDKAADMGLTLRVQVTVEPDGSGVPVPVSVELTGPRSEVLSRWLETELGVPAERQVWNEN